MVDIAMGNGCFIQQSAYNVIKDPDQPSQYDWLVEKPGQTNISYWQDALKRINSQTLTFPMDVCLMEWVMPSHKKWV
jgi:hypothetical protein